MTDPLFPSVDPATRKLRLKHIPVSALLLSPEFRASVVQFWAPGETVFANTIRMSPEGATIKRIAAGITRASFDNTEAALWTVTSGSGGTVSPGTGTGGSTPATPSVDPNDPRGIMALPGFSYWLRGDSATNPTTGAPVTSWNDRGPNNLDAAQPEVARQPSYIADPQSGAMFNGDTLLSTASASLAAETIYVVAKPTDLTGIRALRGSQDGFTAGGRGFIIKAGKLAWTNQGVDDPVLGVLPIQQGVRAIFSGTYSPTRGALFLNGAIDSSETTPSAALAGKITRIGGGYGNGDNFIGTLYEVIAFSAAHTPAERAIVHSMLSDYYGITVEDYIAAPDEEGVTKTLSTVRITGTEIGTSDVTVRWQAVPGNDGIALSGVVACRDGRDSTGQGVWCSSGDLATGSRTFYSLLSGTTYLFSVQPMAAGQPYGPAVTVQATTPGAPPVISTPPPTDSLAVLRSGASIDGIDRVSPNAGEFYTWRGGTRPVAVTSCWSDNDIEATLNVWPITFGDKKDWLGDLDIAPGGVYPNQGDSWSAAASGAYDARWTTMWQRIRDNRQNKPGLTYVRPWHEFTISQYPWMLHNATEVAQFKQAWIRMWNIKQAVFPAAKLVWCPNREASGTPIKSTDAWPGAAYVDVCGVDYYLQFPACPDQAAWNEQLMQVDANGGPKGLGAWRAFAQSVGKALVLPEYGTNADFGDQAEGQLAMLNYMEANQGIGAGQISYAVYFNTAQQNDAFGGRYGLYPYTRIPQTAAAYRAWHRAR